MRSVQLLAAARPHAREAAPGDPPQPRLGHRAHGERREVGRARAVARIEAARVDEVRALEPEQPRALVHALHPGLDGSRAADGERDGGVVAGGDHQTLQQPLGAHATARQQAAHVRPAGMVGDPRDPHAVARAEALDRQQARHELRQARDRQHACRTAAPQHAAVVEVEGEARRRCRVQPQVGQQRRRGEVDARRARGLGQRADRRLHGRPLDDRRRQLLDGRRRRHRAAG